jgi:hypothetical protein
MAFEVQGTKITKGLSNLSIDQNIVLNAFSKREIPVLSGPAGISKSFSKKYVLEIYGFKI